MPTERRKRGSRTERRQVLHGRQVNDAIRGRAHLKPEEVERMIQAARGTRNPERDAALISLTWHHGLRVSEAVALQWDQIDQKRGLIEVRRLKGSVNSVQPLQASELRLLTALRKVCPSDRFLFVSERGTPMDKRSAQHMIVAVGRLAELPFPVNAHALRHAAGYKLANDGATTRDIQAWLGHTNLNNVTRYTALAADRLKRVWRNERAPRPTASSMQEGAWSGRAKEAREAGCRAKSLS